MTFIVIMIWGISFIIRVFITIVYFSYSLGRSYSFIFLSMKIWYSLYFFDTIVECSNYSRVLPSLFWITILGNGQVNITFVYISSHVVSYNASRKFAFVSLFNFLLWIYLCCLDLALFINVHNVDIGDGHLYTLQWDRWSLDLCQYLFG